MLIASFAFGSFLLVDNFMFHGRKSTTKVLAIGTVVLLEIVLKLPAGSTFLQ